MSYISYPSTFKTYLSRKLSLLKIYDFLDYLLNQDFPSSENLIDYLNLTFKNEKREEIIELYKHLQERKIEINGEEEPQEKTQAKRKKKPKKDPKGKTHFHFLDSLLANCKQKFDVALINNNVSLKNIQTPTEMLEKNLDTLVQFMFNKRGSEGSSENFLLFTRLFDQIFEGSLQAKSRFLETIDSHVFLLSAKKNKVFYEHIVSLKHGDYSLLDIFRASKESPENDKILNYELYITKDVENVKPERVVVPDLFPLYTFATFLQSKKFGSVKHLTEEIPDLFVMALCQGYKQIEPTDKCKFYSDFSKDLSERILVSLSKPAKLVNTKVFDLISHIHDPLIFSKMFGSIDSLIKNAFSEKKKIGLIQSKDENFFMLEKVLCECENNDIHIKKSINNPHSAILTSTVVENANNFKQKGVSYKFLLVEGIDKIDNKDVRYSIIKENNVVWLSLYFSLFSEFVEKLIDVYVLKPIEESGKGVCILDKHFYDSMTVRIIRDLLDNQKSTSLVNMLTNVNRMGKKTFFLEKGDEKINSMIKIKHVENYISSETYKNILNQEMINQMCILVKIAIFKTLVFETKYLLEIDKFKYACEESFFNSVTSLTNFQNEKMEENETLFSSFNYTLFTEIVYYYIFQLELFGIFQLSRERVERSALLEKEKDVRKDRSTKILSDQKKARTFSLVPVSGFFLEKESGTVFSDKIIQNLTESGMIHEANLMKKFDSNILPGDKISILCFDKTPYTTEYTSERVPVSKPFDHNPDIEETNLNRQKIFSSFYLRENQLEVNGTLRNQSSFDEEKSEMKECFFRAMKSSPKFSNEHTSLYSIGCNFSLGDMKRSLEKINSQYYTGNLKETKDYILVECDPNTTLKDTELEQTFMSTARQTVPIYKSNQSKINDWLNKPNVYSGGSIFEIDLCQRIENIETSKRMDIHSMPYTVSPSYKNQVVLLFIKQEILVNIQSSVVPCMWERSLISNQIFNNIDENFAENDKISRKVNKKQKTVEVSSDQLKIIPQNIDLPNELLSKSYQIGSCSKKEKSFTCLLKNSLTPSLCNNFCSPDVFRAQMAIKTLISMFSPKLPDRINNQLSTRSSHLKAFSFIYHISSNTDSYGTDFCLNSSFITSFSFDSMEKRKFDENFFDLSEVHSEEIENMLVDSKTVSGSLFVRYKQLLLLEIVRILSGTDQGQDTNIRFYETSKQIFQLVSDQYKKVTINRDSYVIPNELYYYQIFFESGKDKQRAFQDCKEFFLSYTKDLEEEEKDRMYNTIEGIFKEGVITVERPFENKKDCEYIVKNSSLFFVYDYLGANLSGEQILQGLSIDVKNTFAKFPTKIQVSFAKKYLIKEDVKRDGSFFGDALLIALKTEYPLVIPDENVADFWGILKESEITKTEKDIVGKILFPKKPPLKSEETTGNYTEHCNFVSNQYLYAAINQGCPHNATEKGNFVIVNNQKGKSPVDVFKQFTSDISNDIIGEIKAICPICILKFPSKYRESRRSPPSNCVNLNYDLFYKMDKTVYIDRKNETVSFSKLFTQKDFSIPNVYLPLMINFETLFSDNRNGEVDVSDRGIEIDFGGIKISCKIFILSLIIFSKKIPDSSKKKLLSYLKFLGDLAPSSWPPPSVNNGMKEKPLTFSNDKTVTIVLPNTSNPSSRTLNIDELSFVHQQCSTVMFPCHSSPFYFNDHQKNSLVKKIIQSEYTRYFLSEKAIIRGYNITHENKQTERSLDLERKEIEPFEQQSVSLTKNDLIKLVNRQSHISLTKLFENNENQMCKLKLFFANCDSETKGAQNLSDMTNHLLTNLNGEKGTVYQKIMTKLFYSLEYTKGVFLDSTKKNLLLIPLPDLKNKSIKEFVVNPFGFCQAKNLDFLTEDKFMDSLIAQSRTKEIDFPLSIKIKSKKVLPDYFSNMIDAMNFSDLFPVLDEYSICGGPLIKKKSTDSLYYFRQCINFSDDGDELANIVRIKGNSNRNYYDNNPKKKKISTTNNLVLVSDNMFVNKDKPQNKNKKTDKKQSFSYFTKLFQNRTFSSLLSENLSVKLTFIIK